MNCELESLLEVEFASLLQISVLAVVHETDMDPLLRVRRGSD